MGPKKEKQEGCDCIECEELEEKAEGKEDD
jgi:hypothetical protein